MTEIPASGCLWEHIGLADDTYDFSVTTLTNWIQCYVLCSKDWRCKTWTYIPEQKKCYLKTRDYSTTTIWFRKGWMSGTGNCELGLFFRIAKNGFQLNTDWPNTFNFEHFFVCLSGVS